jgi:hypothetical protein
MSARVARVRPSGPWEGVRSDESKKRPGGSLVVVFIGPGHVRHDFGECFVIEFDGRTLVRRRVALARRTTEPLCHLCGGLLAEFSVP